MSLTDESRSHLIAVVTAATMVKSDSVLKLALVEEFLSRCSEVASEATPIEPVLRLVLQLFSNPTPEVNEMGRIVLSWMEPSPLGS